MEAIRYPGTSAGARFPARTGENQQIAAQLREAAELLQAQGANPFRVGAYHRAADTVAGLAQPLREIFDTRGRSGLQALPGIGDGIASAIAEMLASGSWRRLTWLRRAARGRETESSEAEFETAA